MIGAELTLQDFEGGISGRDKQAGVKVDRVIRARREQDPSRTYSQHVSALRSDLQAREKREAAEQVKRAAARTSPPPSGGGIVVPLRRADSAAHLRRLSSLIAGVSTAAAKTGGLCRVTPAQGREIAAAVDACGDALPEQLWRQASALGLPHNADGQERYGRHYIDRLVAAIDAQITTQSPGVA